MNPFEGGKRSGGTARLTTALWAAAAGASETEASKVRTARKVCTPTRYPRLPIGRVQSNEAALPDECYTVHRETLCAKLRISSIIPGTTTAKTTTSSRISSTV